MESILDTSRERKPVPSKIRDSHIAHFEAQVFCLTDMLTVLSIEECATRYNPLHPLAHPSSMLSGVESPRNMGQGRLLHLAHVRPQGLAMGLTA